MAGEDYAEASAARSAIAITDPHVLYETVAVNMAHWIRLFFEGPWHQDRDSVSL